MHLTDDTDSLIDIIGKDRSNYSPEEIAVAEKKLRQAETDSRIQTIKKVKITGIVVAVFGFTIAIFPVIIITEEWDMFSEWGSEANTFTERAFSIFFLFMMAFQIIGGLALSAGGIGFCMLRHWGRRIILVLIWIYITYCVCGFVYFEGTALFSKMHDGVRLPLVLGGLLITVFWVLLLWLAQRYFASQSIKSICK
jgi:hypothetical protein